MDISIRPLTPEDAADVERLYEQSAEHHRALSQGNDFQFNAQIFRRDGFGDAPAFSGIGAVHEGRMVGHLLYTFGYDPDHALRYLFVLDLSVDETLRQQGIGRALMDRAKVLCREAGGRELFWAVHEGNESALRFYRRLGAHDIRGLRFMYLEVEPE